MSSDLGALPISHANDSDLSELLNLALANNSQMTIGMMTKGEKEKRKTKEQGTSKATARHVLDPTNSKRHSSQSHPYHDARTTLQRLQKRVLSTRILAYST
jgi:hypothetical protein